MPVSSARVASAATQRARAFVAAHLAQAVALGRAAGDLAQDPVALATLLRDGLPALADPEYLDGQRRVAPGIGELYGVRNPLLAGVARGLRAATRRDSSTVLLQIADRLLREPVLELRWLAFEVLVRSMTLEPERTWQLLRSTGRTAGDWITVDRLAHVAAAGVLAESFRWAELEQLVYSPSRWERRLAGSTVAVLPFADRVAGRRPDVARRGLSIIGDLLGDAEPDVQKSLSWALRSLMLVDRAAVAAFLDGEAGRAAATSDGNRAWVIRDTLTKFPAPQAAPMRQQLEGIRRRSGDTSTSRAAAAAAEFLGAGIGLDVMPADRAVLARA
jgi:3-methyladenine DNA glycosylase AlkD